MAQLQVLLSAIWATHMTTWLGGGIIGGVAGALIGGVTGYLVCKEEPKPVPPVAVEEPKCDKIVINSVQFDFDKAVIKPEFYPILDEAAAELQKPACAKKNVTIEGNTCNMGSDKYNHEAFRETCCCGQAVSC